MDKVNSNTLSNDAIKKEIKLLGDDFECFRVAEENEVTDAYQKITSLWNFAVKFDDRQCAKLCAGGHKTRDLEIDYYSRVIDLEIICILFVISLLKYLEVVAANVS